jgi:hypothetical protein
LQVSRSGETDQPLFHRLVFDLKMLYCGRTLALQRFGKSRFIAPRILSIEYAVMHVVSCGSQLVGVGAHGGEKQHNFLLVMTNVGAQASILSHKDTDFRCGWQVVERKQLIAEYDKHCFRLFVSGHCLRIVKVRGRTR